MTITLPTTLERLVRERVASGLYSDETEVVCEALRREFAGDALTSWVREQAVDGFAQLDAGQCRDFSREEMMAHLAARRPA